MFWKKKKIYNPKYFTELSSTNTYSISNIELLNDKDIIIAEKQTAGRGRFNRIWLSPAAGNLYLSIILKPHDKPVDELPLSNFTQYTAVIICKVLAMHGISASIKWPNDILVNEKKIAGILSETSFSGNILKGIVVGLGVNLNMPGELLDQIDQPATSLNLLTKKQVNQKQFTALFLDTFFSQYEAFLKKGFTLIQNEYIERSNFLGKRIKIKLPSGIQDCKAITINQDGTLKIMDTQNRESNLSLGEITWKE